MLWIGMISGTSADGVDAALVRLGGSPREIELLGYVEVPLEEDLRTRVHAAGTGSVRLRDLVALDVLLGERFAAAALELLEQAGVRAQDVAGIGSHGQTVGHYPEADVRGSLQIGDPTVIQARTGIPVIADFRRADLAAGGQGAPLTPFFHHAVFADDAEPRAVLNIGGFTNVSYLPDCRPEQVVAFDPGPGNALLDRAARFVSEGAERFDRDGAGARRGRVQPDVLAELLADPYFSKPPPKSTGHEYFDADFFERARERVGAAGGDGDSLLATLTALTVESVADAARRFFPEPVERWLVYGGGVRNPALLEGLRAKLAPAVVETTDAFGVPPAALEAMAFAVLGWCSARGIPGNLPAATGAERAVVLGAAVPPGAFRPSA
jgi:anhydro-N-acetylmuramic acid kinase